LAIIAISSTTVRMTAQTGDTTARFEVASIKRNVSGDLSNPAQILPSGEVRVVNTSVRGFIARAYAGEVGFEVVGLPSWAESERYDVVAKGKPNATTEEMQQMWRALLAERMKLAAHHETHEKPSYDLVMARKDGRLGPGLKPSTLDCTQPPTPGPPPARSEMKAFGLSRCRTLTTDPADETTYAGGLTMSFLAQVLGGTAGRPIVDKTGLDGYYSITIRYQRFPQRAGVVPSPDDPPSVFTALEEQLGLKLEASKMQAQVMIVDHIERPDVD
jgi:uncharacterized protein (TIGR03435 family)